MNAPRDYLLEVNDLRCGYGAFEAVHGLSFGIHSGQTVALVGANGAGKSTTIMCLAGHVLAGAGQITFAGEPLNELTPEQRVKRGIAVAPEGRRLFADLTVRENLVVGGFSRPKGDFQAACERVFEYFPRLAERAGQRAGTLSGGEQQMLAIGRALMSAPKLVLVDELSLGLMPKVVDICYRVLESLKRDGLTVLLVEQNTERALDIADHLLLMETGNLRWQGNVSELRARPDVLAAILPEGRRETVPEA